MKKEQQQNIQLIKELFSFYHVQEEALDEYDPQNIQITNEQQRNKLTIKELLSCYHVKEEALDEDDPPDIQIEEEEGER